MHIKDQIESAIDEGELKPVRRLLATHPELLHVSHCGCTWLQRAVASGSLPIVQLLIDLGCDVNADCGQLAMAEELCEKGYDIDSGGVADWLKNYHTEDAVLESAVSEDNLKIVRLLLENRANPNKGRTVIAAIADLGDRSLEKVKLLERYGADLHRVFANELTEPKEPMNALSTAIAWGKDDVAAYLRSRGAVLPTALPPEPPPTTEQTIADAVSRGDIERTRQLLTDNPELVHSYYRRDSAMQTWLHVAAWWGDVDVVELLLSLGCNVNAESKEHPRTPLDAARNAAVTRCLVEHGADVQCGAAESFAIGDHPHSLEMVRLLDRYGADLNAVSVMDAGTDEPPETDNALKAAIRWGTISLVGSKDDVVEYLRSRGAVLPDAKPDSGSGSHSGSTWRPDDLELAIVDAVRSGDVERIRGLLTEHPDYVKKLHGGHTWLQVAAHYNSVAMIRLLIEFGIDVNAEGVARSVALDAAVGTDNPVIVSELLEHRANPNQGKQVLWAVTGPGRRNCLDIVKLLDQYGADFSRRFINQASDAKIQTCAFALAKDWGMRDVMDYLQVRGKAAQLKGAQPSLTDQIIAYFTKEFGPVQRPALMEIVPTDPPIAIHVVPASKERKCITLFTTGMSAQPMTLPDGWDDFQYAELFVQLPADWPYTKIEDPNYGWPIHWLRSTAKYPLQNDTWLGGPAAIIANDDPRQPVAPNTRFTSLLFVVEKSFVSSNGMKIYLYRMEPLYTEERDLEMREGIGALLQAFDKREVSLIVDLKRQSVA